MPTLLARIVRCPFCRAKISVYETRCGSCGSELTLLSDLNLLPYQLYNQGLEAYRQGDLKGALFKLAAANELGGRIGEAEQLLARVVSELGIDDRGAAPGSGEEGSS